MGLRITRNLLQLKVDLLNEKTKEKYYIRRMYGKHYIFTENGCNVMCGTMSELFYHITFTLRILENEENLKSEV